MPTYEVNIPGQGTFQVDSPTPLTDYQAYQHVLAQYKPPAPTPQAETGILAGLKKGVLSPFSSIRTGIESLIPEENAPENAALKGIQRQEELAKKYESSANLEKVKQAYQDKGLLSAAGEAISQVPGALAEQVPQLGAMWTGAVAGRKVGGTYGAVIGAAAPLIAQFYGTNIERQAQEQVKSGDPVKIDRGNAALASVGQTALDMVEARLLFGNKFISKTLGIEAKNLASMPTALVEKQAQEKLLPLILKGTGRGILAEIPTEVTQQVLERAQAGLPLTSPDAIAEYGDTMYNVALLGPLGVAGRLSERGAARGELAGREAADAAIARDQQLQATQAAQPTPAPVVPQMAPVTPGPTPTTQENLFTKEEVPTQLAPDVLEATTAKGKPLEIPAPQAAERQLSELQRNIDTLIQQGTPESFAEAEQLKAQLPEVPEARVQRLGEEMMALERKYKALETIRDETKALKEKEPLSLQMNQIRERQNEILKEGIALKKEGVSFEAPPEQMSLNLENKITEDDFKTMGIGRTNKKLREAILGRSLSDPKERAFVINALETYAQGNISEGLATRVGNFADEIKKGAPSGTVSDVGAGAGKPSVPVLGGEFESARGVAAPAATGLAGAEPVVGGPAVGERAAGEVGKAALTGELKGKSTIDLADRITQKDLKGALQDIATSKQYTPLDNLVARRLLQSKTLPKVEIVSPEVTKGYPAQYDPNIDTVQITPGNIDSHTVLHETVHGFLHAMIRTSEAREAKGLGGNPNLKNLKDVYAHVKEKRPDLAEKYGMKDLSEFASEVMSNPDFQNDLRNTPYKRTNIFSEFARAVLRALGISPDAFNNADVDSLVAALTATERALSTGRKTQEDIQGGVRQQIEPEIARALGNDYEFSGPDTVGMTDKRIKDLFSDSAYTMDDAKAKGYIGYVSPQRFLDATRTYDEADRQESKENRPLDTKALAEESQHIFLTVEKSDMFNDMFNITGHEGRHRMMALRDAGVTQVPVYFRFYQGEKRSIEKFIHMSPQRFGSQSAIQGFMVNELVPVNYDNYKFIKEKFGVREGQIAYKEPGAFKNWFGDSKVVNPDGSPMVVYHGTTQDVKQFKMSKEGSLGAGIYMTPNTSFANNYAGMPTPSELADIEAGGFMTPQMIAQLKAIQETGELVEGQMGGNVMPVYASIENPLIINTIDRRIDPAVDLLVALGVKREKAEDIVEKANEDKGGITKEVMSRAQKQGYDGIMQYKDGVLSEVVAFSPYQVKSAIGNTGEYSRTTADIARLERTPQGAQAEQDMAAFGGRPEQKAKGFVEKNRDSFQKVAKDWRAAAERNDSKVAATFGKFQNIASFDQAFNNRLYNHFMGLKNQGVITLQEAKDALLRISTSQALHRTNLANQIIDRGNFTYDADSNRWYAVDDPVNMGKFEEIINSVADRLGVEPTRARQIVGAAYEANRLNSMYDSLRVVEKELAAAERDILKIKDAKQRATKKELIKGLEEKIIELEGKARHKTPEQVAAGMRLYNSIPEIKQGTEIWNTMRGRVVKMLVDTGVKTEEQAEAWLDEAAYVPFFRDIEEEKAVGPNVMARGLRESMGDPYMRGSMKEVHDPIDNMYKWMQWSIARAVSNQQLNVMLDQYKAALPDEVREGKGPDSNTFTVYRDGKLRFYNVADPAIAQAFVGLEPIIFPGISWLTGSSNFLRHAVTRNPLFSAGQLFMDSYTAMFTSGLKSPFGVLKEIAKEVAATMQGRSITRTELMKAGILETHDYAALTEADAIGKRLGLEKPGAWAKLAQRLDHLAAASDNVIRQGIYNQAIKEKLSHEEAMEKAAEIVNFRRVSGDSRIQFLSRIVPFFNAYLQVSSVAVKTLTGRGISPQERDAAAKVLMATTAKIAMISMLYSMAVGDDDDYKKKNRITRDRMWMIPGTGGLGVPVRSDIFSLPKVIGEYSYHMIADNGYTDSKMVKEALSRAVMGSLSVPSEGIPQFVRPTLGVMTNYDFFQKREIVNATMRKLDVSEQYTKNTSEMSRAFSAILGKLGIEASPLNIDYLVKGYLGTAGTLTAMATNDIIAGASGRTRPSMSMTDFVASIPNASAFVSREENTAVLSDFYEAARDVNKVVATASHLKNTPEARRAYMEEHKKEYQLKGMTQAINNQLVMIKRQEMRIRESNKSSEQKEQELKQLDARRSNLAARVQNLRQRLYE